MEYITFWDRLLKTKLFINALMNIKFHKFCPRFYGKDWLIHYSWRDYSVLFVIHEWELIFRYFYFVPVIVIDPAHTELVIIFMYITRRNLAQFSFDSTTKIEISRIPRGCHIHDSASVSHVRSGIVGFRTSSAGSKRLVHGGWQWGGHIDHVTEGNQVNNVSIIYLMKIQKFRFIWRRIRATS